MAEGVNTAWIRTLAEANGISIPDDRLDIVLKQYQTYLEFLKHLDLFLLSREEEPSVKFELPAAGSEPGR